MPVEIEQHLAAAGLEAPHLLAQRGPAALGGVGIVFRVAGVVPVRVPAEHQQGVDAGGQAVLEDLHHLIIAIQGLPVLVAHDDALPAAHGVDMLRTRLRFEPAVGPGAIDVGSRMPGAGVGLPDETIAGNLFAGPDKGILGHAGLEDIAAEPEKMQGVLETRIVTADVESVIAAVEKVAVAR